jgi:hypothetical protein
MLGVVPDKWSMARLVCGCGFSFSMPSGTEGSAVVMCLSSGSAEREQFFENMDPLKSRVSQPQPDVEERSFKMVPWFVALADLTLPRSMR